MTQLDLDWTRPPPVRHNHPETSYAAANAIAPVTGKLRQAVYSFFVERGAYGATDAELFTAWPEKPENSLRPRRIELVEAGKIIDSGKRRQNRPGAVVRGLGAGVRMAVLIVFLSLAFVAWAFLVLKLRDL